MKNMSAALPLFLLFQSLYALTSSGNAFRVPDEFEVYFQAEHLIDAGDLSIPQTLAIRAPVRVDGRVAGSEPIFFGKVGRDGKPYAPYGPLTAFLLLPHHLVARAIASIAGVPREPLPAGIAWVFLVGGLTALSSATAAALAVVGFHRAALALGTPPRNALLWSLALGGTTVMWPYGTTLYSEAWQAAALAWAAALLLGAPTRRDVVLAACLLAIAVLTKVTSLILVTGFLTAAAFDARLDRRSRLRVTASLACGVAIAVGVHLTWNWYRFQNVVDFGYDWAETIPRPPARPFVMSEVPRGLAVLLFSPGKSLFIWAPVLLFSVLSARQFWQRHRTAAIGLFTTAAIGCLLYAAYQFPEGGYAHGPRHLVPIVPLLLLPAAASTRKWPHVAIGLCAAAGFTMAVLATSVSFLEDQGLGGDLGGGARTAYYERIDPPPGRPWNRYRLDYVPLVDTLRSAEWRDGATLGLGPDYFPLHLLQARRQVPNGQTISPGLIYGMPLAWLMLFLLATGLVIRRLRTIGKLVNW